MTAIIITWSALVARMWSNWKNVFRIGWRKRSLLEMALSLSPTSWSFLEYVLGANELRRNVRGLRVQPCCDPDQSPLGHKKSHAGYAWRLGKAKTTMLRLRAPSLPDE